MTIELSQSIDKQIRHLTRAYVYGNKKHRGLQTQTNYIASYDTYIQLTQIPQVHNLTVHAKKVHVGPHVGILGPHQDYGEFRGIMVSLDVESLSAKFQ